MKKIKFICIALICVCTITLFGCNSQSEKNDSATDTQTGSSQE